MTIRVPASTANLGPGFDALGMALDVVAEFGVVDTDEMPDRSSVVDANHPADIAFRRAGGEGDLWVRSSIPVGKGMGFSGAMRVGGVAAAVSVRRGFAGLSPEYDLSSDHEEILTLASELEGHADNAAASLLGGVVATAGGVAVRVPLAIDPVVVVWVPSMTTSTDKSRSVLPSSIDLAAATFNIGRTALLVAALAAGRTDVLSDATRDAIHQDVRLAERPDSRAALEAGVSAGAWCGWLSGSGPTVAFLVPTDQAEIVAEALPNSGHAKRLRIDHAGAVFS